MLKGTFTAIVTPFTDGKINYEEFSKIIDEQIEKKINGIVPCGTTGESPTLSNEEHMKVIEFTVKQTAGRALVIGGSGSNDTASAIKLTKHCEEIGCDAALLVSPYYNKPNQNGLYEHYKKISENVNIPIVLYNVPGRTACTIQPQTIAELSKNCSNIIAVKDATGDIVGALETIRLAKKGFTVLSGNDDIVYPLLSIGGKGVISVVSNVAPEKMLAVTDKYFDGDFAGSLAAHLDILPLCKSMFLETNPIPVKAAMSIAGKCSGELRLPLTELDDDNRQKLTKILKEYQII